MSHKPASGEGVIHKPRLILMRTGPVRGMWRCLSDRGPAGFGWHPAQAYGEWAKWQSMVAAQPWRVHPLMTRAALQ